MSLQIGLIIAGIVLVLLALISELLSLGIRSKVRIPLGILGVLLIIYGGYSYGTINTLARIEQASVGNIKQVEYPVEKMQIISPLEGDSVDCRILTKGVYPKSHDKGIWVLVKPSDNFYYPQSDYTNTSYKRKGKWQVITRFGGDKGEKYDIIAYETDSTASVFFSSTIEKWKDKLSYPGLEKEEIPEGAIEKDRIVVSLRENCRGVF